MEYSHERYAELIEETIAKVVELGKFKGGEYAGDDDRLANFRRNGIALGLPMETVWAVYAAKHWDAVQQYIKDLQHGKQRQRLESIEGRVDDLIVYLLLFKAMIDERENAHTNELVELAAKAGTEINNSRGWPFKKPSALHGDFGSLQPTNT